MAYNDEDNIRQPADSNASYDFPNGYPAGMKYPEPTNAEIMQEIQKNRKLMILLLFVTIITLITFIVVSVYLYNIVSEYKDEVTEAFNTMKKIDNMVEQLEADYTNYSSKIDEFFDVVNELQTYLDNFKNVVGSLPSIQLPF